MKRKFQRRSRIAMTEVVGAVLMIAVTLVVGFAAWAWASSAAVNSENSYGNAIGSNINSLNEQFSVVNANFSSPLSTKLTVWFYNNGDVTVYIKQIWISNATWTNTTTSLSSTNTPNCGYCLKLPVGNIACITLNVNTPFEAGVAYQMKALGMYGNTYSYLQTA